MWQHLVPSVSAPFSSLIPGLPFRSTLEEAEFSEMQTQESQRGPKPRWWRTSRRYAQLTESKALEMSSLMNRLGVFDLWSSLIRFCT
jgi:hypothetical protein